MRFNEHYRIKGQHALLSASQYHWINYDEDRMVEKYRNHRAAAEGTRLHAVASELIQLGIRQARNNKTFNQYVNDAIGYRMETEQVLFYSENCFGTADAIGFRKNLLRIFDLKNGKTPASINQLRVYAALFCLEYEYSPVDIQMDLRIYQNDEVLVEEPEPDDILYVMERIVTFDKIIRDLKDQEGP